MSLRFVVVVCGNLLGCPPMNILIENGDTLEYLTEAGQWTVVNTFPALLQNHRDLLRDKGALVQLFSEGREVEEFKRLRVERYETMARRGLITFMDGMETCWHYTLRGAVRHALLNYTIGLVRAITHGRVFRCV